jgi:hypothetical protein
LTELRQVGHAFAAANSASLSDQIAGPFRLLQSSERCTSREGPFAFRSRLMDEEPHGLSLGEASFEIAGPGFMPAVVQGLESRLDLLASSFSHRTVLVPLGETQEGDALAC